MSKEKKTLDLEEINENVYNAVLTIYKKYININGFAKNFPEICPNSSDTICGVNEYLLKKEVKGLIPDFSFMYKADNDYIDENEKYALLDFIEYCYDNIYDVEQYEYHDYFSHNHYKVKKTRDERNNFKDEINRIFERNGIIFFLDEDGKIKRKLPLEMDSIIRNINLDTKDERLNELIGQAIDNIQKPNLFDRKIGLEKLWDAYERMKTYYLTDKKESASKLIKEVSKETEKFEDILEKERKELDKIGNDYYQIRHFGKGEIEIKSSKHIDYLFYRMLALINLCVSELK